MVSSVVSWDSANIKTPEVVLFYLLVFRFWKNENLISMMIDDTCNLSKMKQNERTIKPMLVYEIDNDIHSLYIFHLSSFSVFISNGSGFWQRCVTVGGTSSVWLSLPVPDKARPCHRVWV